MSPGIYPSLNSELVIMAFTYLLVTSKICYLHGPMITMSHASRSMINATFFTCCPSGKKKATILKISSSSSSSSLNKIVFKVFEILGLIFFLIRMENVILHLSVMQSLDYILCLLSSLHIFFPSSLFFPCLLYSLLIFYSHLTSFSSTLPCRINSTQNVFIEGVLKR